MLIARERDYHIPDSIYLLMKEKYIPEETTMVTLLTDGIYNYAHRYLELCDEIIIVNAERFDDWQMQLCWWSPLVLKASLLAKNFLRTGSVTEYLHKYILPNFKYTALPSTYILQMENLRCECGGMAEEHFHLNGALETDITWQDILRSPDYVYEEMNKVYEQEMVREMYDQLLYGITPLKLRDRWLMARRLRSELYNLIFRIKATEQQTAGYEHPLLYMLGSQANDIPPMMLEAMFMVMIFQYLTYNNDEVVARKFHHYLLLLGQTNKLLVQNNRMYGFREFQKYTTVGMREYSELYYKRRYMQMCGNNQTNCRYIEGRFSPKKSERDNEDLINRILSGFNVPNVNLALIAHFIKKSEGKPTNIRHEVLRSDLCQRAEVLCSMIKAGHPLMEKLVGIDAAANELDAPAEVFAEAYSMLRIAGIKHFTYHAGEDFYHIISGLRSIYEAVEFLDLRCGDRIGHAVACGVDPNLWYRNMGDCMLIRRGEYMDSLLIMYKLILEEASDKIRLTALIPQIEREIFKLSYCVYKEDVGISLLLEAWRKRKDNPAKILCKMNKSKEEEILSKYHCKIYRRFYDEIIEMRTIGIFGLDELELLQQALLKKMHRHEIVIETLPTSNVIIGHHHDFSTYHLYKWYCLQTEGKPIPPIIIGSDDAGIFATNIYNEYCHIYTMLVFTHQEPYQRVMAFIRWLDDNAKVYGFLAEGG